MTNPDDPKPSNPRRERQQADKRLLVLVGLTLVVVGGGLIALIFGWQTLFTSLPILLGGMLLILGPWLLLLLLQKWRDSLE